MHTELWALPGVLAFAGLSFFFALAETALFSLGRWQAREIAGRGPAGALVARLLAEPQDLLASIVLGNTFANAGLVLLAAWIALQSAWSPLEAVLAGLLLLGLLLVGCEVVPKTLAVRSPEHWALRVARPMVWLDHGLRPLRRVAQRGITFILRVIVPRSVKPQTGLADEEYHELLEMAFQQGTLGQAEKEIILQIIRLDRRTVRDVMQPLSRMACIPDDLSIEDMLEAARRHRHRRLPIYDGSPDTIVGVLNTRALLLDPAIDLADAIEFPSFVPDSMNLLQLLKSLQRQKRGLAIVLDEFGGAAGLIALEDILEEVVGHVRGEVESRGFVMEKLAPDRWRVSGTMRLEDFRREYPELGEHSGVETMGGLLVSLLEVVPAPGQSASAFGLKLTASSTDDRRVRELLVERPSPGKAREP